MNAKNYFNLSVCANVVLAGVAFHLSRQPAVRALASATDPVVVAVRTLRNFDADGPSPVTCVTNRFHWHTIESGDYGEYVANLRAIGCPEKTIRDIIVADVESHYADRRREVGTKGPFWLAGSSRREAERAQEKRLQALKQEQMSLIRQLLGIEWLPERDPAFEKFEEQALMRFVFGPMPEENVRQVVHVFQKYEALKQEVKKRCGGIQLDEDKAQLAALYQQMWGELASMLTPLQLEELKARGAAVEFIDRVKMDGVGVTPRELRQIVLAKAAAGGRLFDWPEDETDEEQSAHEERFHAAVKDILGESRYAEFKRAQDGEFRSLLAVTKDNNLAKELAVKVYNLRELALEEAGRIRRDASLDEPARRLRLDEMQAAVQKGIVSALGAAAWQDYLNRGGSWVSNLNQL